MGAAYLGLKPKVKRSGSRDVHYTAKRVSVKEGEKYLD
jgi:hypothetical protein